MKMCNWASSVHEWKKVFTANSQDLLGATEMLYAIRYFLVSVAIDEKHNDLAIVIVNWQWLLNYRLSIEFNIILLNNDVFFQGYLDFSRGFGNQKDCVC